LLDLQRIQKEKEEMEELEVPKLDHYKSVAVMSHKDLAA